MGFETMNDSAAGPRAMCWTGLGWKLNPVLRCRSLLVAELTAIEFGNGPIYFIDIKSDTI
jgi:hypothetical protein